MGGFSYFFGNNKRIFNPKHVQPKQMDFKKAAFLKRERIGNLVIMCYEITYVLWIGCPMERK